MKTLRNIAFAGLLWAAASVAAPSEVSALWCDHIPYFANWGGRCAPGGQDACGYFTSECSYYCFTHYSGALCWADFYLCQQYNAGTEEFPEYCLDSAICQCVTDW